MSETELCGETMNASSSISRACGDLKEEEKDGNCMPRRQRVTNALHVATTSRPWPVDSTQILRLRQWGGKAEGIGDGDGGSRRKSLPSNRQLTKTELCGEAMNGKGQEVTTVTPTVMGSNQEKGEQDTGVAADLPVPFTSPVAAHAVTWVEPGRTATWVSPRRLFLRVAVLSLRWLRIE